MILRIDKCPKCGNQVAVVLPDLFPNLNAKSMERFKRISLSPISNFCKYCIKVKEEN